MDIDFITFIGPNSSDYAEYLKHTCEVFLSGKHNIKWKCVESVGADRIPKGYDRIMKAPDTGHNSLNHGTAMNMALKHIESEYVVFIDADMAVVYQDWDDVVVNELNSHSCFGVSYSHSTKYRNFPTVYFFAFRKYILDKVELDFRPSVTPGVDRPNRLKLTKHHAELFGMKPGSVIKCDTGWKLPLIVKGAGFTSKSIPMVMMGSKKAQLPFENKYHKKLCMQKPGHMYEWHYNGKVFTTHKQASRVHPLNETWGDAWKRKIDLYIKRNKK
ncbi:MAG: glycosyltransferase family A protein [Candidatus Thorarchaeota archaeon]